MYISEHTLHKIAVTVGVVGVVSVVLAFAMWSYHYNVILADDHNLIREVEQKMPSDVYFKMRDVIADGVYSGNASFVRLMLENLRFRLLNIGASADEQVLYVERMLIIDHLLQLESYDARVLGELDAVF